MTNRRANDREIEPPSPTTRQVTISERFNAVLYPFDLVALIEALPAHGWIVSDVPDGDEDSRLVKVPVKGNNRLRVDQGNKTLGVGGRVLTEVLEGYREIRDLAREVTPPSAEVSTHFVELRYIGSMPSPLIPMEALSQFWTADAHMVELGKILARKFPATELLLPHGLRLATVAPDANRTDWCEVNIQPGTISARSGYQFDLIYRNADSALVEEVAERADEILRDLISEIEGTDGHRRNR